MRCEYFRCTMRTALCLEYQARARGQFKTKGRFTQANQARYEQWQIKYKPCLNCEQGQTIAAQGGQDNDVENLLANANNTAARQLKRCATCRQELPATTDNFYRNKSNKDGWSLSCKTCQREIQSRSYRKLKGLPIDQNAPIIASKVDNDAIETQSNHDNLNNIKHKDIASPMLNNDPNVNITNDMTAPVAAWQGEMVTLTRTCARCGWTGPENKFHTAGQTGIINVCRKCISKTRQANAERKAKLTAELGPQEIVLSFVDYPEILETLTAAAKQNFRTLGNEILYRLVNSNV